MALLEKKWTKMRAVPKGCRKWVNWGIKSWVTKWAHESGCHVGYATVAQGIWEKTPEECMAELSALPSLD